MVEYQCPNCKKYYKSSYTVKTHEKFLKNPKRYFGFETRKCRKDYCWCGKLITRIDWKMGRDLMIGREKFQCCEKHHKELLNREICVMCDKHKSKGTIRMIYCDECMNRTVQRDSFVTAENKKIGEQIYLSKKVPKDNYYYNKRLYYSRLRDKKTL